jgi:hypothetical protein
MICFCGICHIYVERLSIWLKVSRPAACRPGAAQTIAYSWEESLNIPVRRISSCCCVSHFLALPQPGSSLTCSQHFFLQVVKVYTYVWSIATHVAADSSSLSCHVVSFHGYSTLYLYTAHPRRVLLLERKRKFSGRPFSSRLSWWWALWDSLWVMTMNRWACFTTRTVCWVNMW